MVTNRQYPMHSIELDDSNLSQDDDRPNDPDCLATPSNSPGNNDAPSVERMRLRRIESLAKDGRDNSNSLEHGAFEGRSGIVKSHSFLFGMITILCLVLLSQKDKIMNDIRHSRRKANNIAIWLPSILTTYILLCPLSYTCDLILKVIELICHTIAHPLDFSRVAGSLLHLLAEDAREALGGMYFGVISMVGWGGKNGAVENRTVKKEINRRKSSGNEGSDSPPELEDSSGEEPDQCDYSMPRPRQEHRIVNDREPHEIRYDMDDLEPAFRTEEEYPVGWLVYHPRYGVITRERRLELECASSS